MTDLSMPNIRFGNMNYFAETISSLPFRHITFVEHDN